MVSLYFGGYLLALGDYYVNDPSFFIYLTNWSFLILNVYLLYAALSTTVEFFKVYVCCRHHYNAPRFERDIDEFDVIEPKGCFSREYNQIRWHHMIQWVLHTLGTQAAVCVVVLYWSLLFRGGEVGLSDGHVHLGNGILSVVDALVSGVPVRLLHFYMIQIYAASYASFTGIYYVAGGTGFNGTSYIYPPLDYERNPGFAAGLCIGVIILVPLLHLAFYGLYMSRYWLVYLLYGRRGKPSVSPVPQEDQEFDTSLSLSMRGISDDVD